MKVDKVYRTDVLVVGAGIAGIMAALSAAEKGAEVCLVSSRNIFSGSSFYPGTWGFGLIGPENAEDIDDLKETIKDVGMNMSDDELVDVFIEHIDESIGVLKDYGVPLREAENKDEKAFIPCFDHKSRSWNGIVQKGAKDALSLRLEQARVRLMPDVEIIDTMSAGGKVVSAIGVHLEYGISRIECKSMVIATGGLGGLFKYRLNTSDIKAMGHYLALKAGAELVNIEFMQMMPGFLTKAPKTIFNEKIFIHSEFLDPSAGASIFEGYSPDELDRLLEMRSTHGPFTSRLESKWIDFEIFRRFSKDERGVTLRYKKTIKDNPQEFVRIYFNWLRENKHLTMDEEVQLGIFYHASNGGIRINPQCETGIPGLYACGEATGGMHGADRIGGLSTANGLVFGRIAGRNAARYAEHQQECADMPEDVELFRISEARKLTERVQELNFRAAMLERTESKVRDSLVELDEIEKGIVKKPVVMLRDSVEYFREIRDTYELIACIEVSKHVLNAILLRKESRGSHYRTDYPFTDSECGYPITTFRNSEGHICCKYQKEERTRGGL